MDNNNATLNTKLDTTNATLNSKVDHITTHLNTQDLKINDLSQRVESLEKHLTYADVTKSPPKPIIPANINANTNTNTNTNNVTTKSEPKNNNLTPEEIMKRSKNIIGIFPINTEDIERNNSNTKEETLIKTGTEFLQEELGFRQEKWRKSTLRE